MVRIDALHDQTTTFDFNLAKDAMSFTTQLNIDNLPTMDSVDAAIMSSLDGVNYVVPVGTGGFPMLFPPSEFPPPGSTYIPPATGPFGTNFS